MRKEGYYSTGQFSKMSNVTKKTLRYYDEKNILKPSFVSESGARFYTDDDLMRLQQILLLKYLGFSLADIREMLLSESDSDHLDRLLQIQKKLVEDKIDQLQIVYQTISDAENKVRKKEPMDWEKMLELTRITGMENSMQNQYKNASNISARIQLHKTYSKNKKGWFSFIYDELELHENMKVLEIGAGDGSLWKENEIPKNIDLLLTDITDGIIRDLRRSLEPVPKNVSFQVCSIQDLPFEDETFDLVIANHVLFYAEDLKEASKEIKRVLKKNGRLIAGTYGKNHMKEVSALVSDFDERIRLSETHLYDLFGKENGKNILSPEFQTVSWLEYEDELNCTEAEPLIAYVISCHGNQNQYIVDSYQEFKNFVRKKTEKGFKITKEAGIFIATK